MAKKTNSLGVVSSGGGLRTYYNAGMFYMLKKYKCPITHISAASGGVTAGALIYLGSEHEDEIEEHTLELIKTQDFFSFKKSLLQPSFFNLSGGFLVELDRSFIWDQFKKISKRQTFIKNLQKIRLDVSVTELAKQVKNIYIHFNPLILEERYDEALDVLQATTCTIPLTKALKTEEGYRIDGGYTKNSPLKPIFQNPDIKKILLIDFTHYEKYKETIERCYRSNPLQFFDNFMEMLELSMQISFDACNRTQLDAAFSFNDLIRDMEGQKLVLKGHTYVYKEVIKLEPKNLEMNPLHHNAQDLAKQYYELGKIESEKLILDKKLQLT